jgi:ribonuclease VapC
MFIDASAIISILAAEPDAGVQLAKIETSRKRHVSAIVVFETVVSLARILANVRGLKERPIPRELMTLAEDKVAEFLVAIAAEDVPVNGQIGSLALEAAKAFGKFTGHKADLNFGDCFAYACAASLQEPLLFKGDDFVHTDIRPA